MGEGERMKGGEGRGKGRRETDRRGKGEEGRNGGRGERENGK